MIWGSFQGPLSEFMHPPSSVHIHVPPKNSGKLLLRLQFLKIQERKTDITFASPNSR